MTTTTKTDTKPIIKPVPDLTQLLKNCESLKVSDYKKTLKQQDVKQQFIDFIVKNTELVKTRENKVYIFTAKMMCDTFKINDAKYYSDRFWAISQLNKKSKDTPILYNIRRGVYKLATPEDFK